MTSRVIDRPTYQKLIALFDNYVKEAGSAEDDTNQERQEISDFLDAILDTNLMEKTRLFLRDKGYLVAQTKRIFKQALSDLWFRTYSRARGALDSSAFEHVFVGETKNREVGGLHNWVRSWFLFLLLKASIGKNQSYLCEFRCVIICWKKITKLTTKDLSSNAT